MKKFFRYLSLIGLFAVIMLLACSCSYKSGKINTKLNLNENLGGERIISLSIENQNETDIETIRKVINGSCPETLNLKEELVDGTLNYDFVLEFDSKEDYIEKLSSLLAYEPNIILANYDTIFTKGIKLEEDFDSKELLSFIPNNLEKLDKNAKVNLRLKNSSTKVTYKEKEYKTKAIISLKDVSYETVDKIALSTVNNNNGTYNRIIDFYLPSKTVTNLKDELSGYFSGRVGNNGNITYSDSNGGQKVSIDYKDISIDELTKETNKLFEISKPYAIEYIDKRETSTVFDKRKSFIETIDTSAYSSKNGKNVPLEYNYKCLNTELVNADSYEKGELQEIGKIEDDNFSYSTSDAIQKINISNHNYYQAKEIHHYLTANGNDEYTRAIEFIYNQDDKEAIEYNLAYLNSFSDILVGKSQTGADTVCKLSVTGNIDNISNKLTEVIGEGNTISYNTNKYLFSAYTVIELKDNIAMKQLISDNNEYIKMKYTIYENEKISLNKLSCKTGKKEEKIELTNENRENIEFDLNDNDAVIKYSGEEINIIGVISIILLVIAVISIGILVAGYMLKRSTKPPKKPNAKNSKNKQDDTNSDDINDILSKI